MNPGQAARPGAPVAAAGFLRLILGGAGRANPG